MRLTDRTQVVPDDKSAPQDIHEVSWKQLEEHRKRIDPDHAIPKKGIVLDSHRFEYVCDLEVKSVADPGAKYPDRARHPYGVGPFCSFAIPGGYNGGAGVYALVVNGASRICR